MSSKGKQHLTEGAFLMPCRLIYDGADGHIVHVVPVYAEAEKRRVVVKKQSGAVDECLELSA